MMQVQTMKQEDIPRVDELCKKASMATPHDYDVVRVVRASESEPIVGFVRLNIIEGIAYLEPIIIDASLRGTGVGRLLLEDVMERYDDIRCVARGESSGFYLSLGFHEVPWDELDPKISGDCPTCERLATCNPLPVAWHRK